MPNINTLSGSLDIRTYEDYEGPYTVNPDEDRHILPTTGKKAHDNILVTEIPDIFGDVYRIGDTLYIL